MDWETQQAAKHATVPPTPAAPVAPEAAKHGHRFLWLYVTVIVAALVGGGVYAWQHKKVNDLNTRLSGLQSQITTLQSQQTAANTPTSTSAVTTPTTSTVDTSNWKTYSLPAGHFSFKYKSGWKIASGGDCTKFCYTPGAAFISPDGQSIGTEGPAHMMTIQMQSGDKRSQDYGLQGVSVGNKLVSTTNVTADGISGKQYKFLLTQTNPLGPAKGAKYIVYTFYTNGRTYSAAYTLPVSSHDYSDEFVAMVEKTLKFTS